MSPEVGSYIHRVTKLKREEKLMNVPESFWTSKSVIRYTLSQWIGPPILVISAVSMVWFSCITSATTASSRSPGGTDLQMMVDEYLQPYVESKSFSGVILLARGDEILLNRGYGTANYEHSVANGSETKFMIASISKTFTAAAVLLLQEQGRLHLTDPVGRFIPDFPHGDRITIHHLLVHTSGLPRFVFLPDYGEKSRQPHSAKDLVDWIRDKPLAFSPGEGEGYSNANYAMLAYIIEIASGLNYGEFLKSSIFDPLDLKDTGHRGYANALIEHLASGYVPVGLTDLERSRYHDYSVDTGSGSIYTTTEDLYGWYSALRHGRMLRRESLALMFKNHVNNRGYGWNISKRVDQDVISMDGWDGVGFSSRFVHYPKEDLTIIVLCNLNISTITEEIADNIARIAFGEDYQQLSLMSKPAVDISGLQEMTGLYHFGSDFYVPGATMRIVESEGRLLIPGNPPAPNSGLLPLSDGEFIHRQQWFRVSFDRNDKGQVVGMKYGPFMVKKESGE